MMVSETPFSAYAKSANKPSIFFELTNDARQAKVLSTKSPPPNVTTRQPARLPRLPKMYFTIMGSLEGSNGCPRKLVTWEEWEELAWLFQHLSIQSAPWIAQFDDMKSTSAMDIDFAFDNASARPAQRRTAASKPLSTLHNFNSKQRSGTRKRRVRAAGEVEVPASFTNFLDQQMNLAQLERAIPASHDGHTHTSMSQFQAMFRFTGLDMQNLHAAPPNLSTSANMVKGPIRTRNYHLKAYGMSGVSSKSLSKHSARVQWQSRIYSQVATNMETNLPDKKLPACFSSLPTELRLMCYRFARPEARIVKLSYSKHYKPDEWPPRLYSGAAVPNLLRVCKESRELALPWYSPRSDAQRSLHSRIQRKQHGPSFYFDWSQDYLYIQCNNCRGNGCDTSELRSCGVCMLGHIHRRLLKRILFEFSGPDSVLWHPLIWYTELEHVKCIHWESGLLFRHEGKLSDFVEIDSKYHWQEGKTVWECFDTQRLKSVDDSLGRSLCGVKSFSGMALRQPNTLSDVLENTKIQWMKGRAARGLRIKT